MRIKRKLGFDIDGVLYPWHEVVLEDLIHTGYVPRGTPVEHLFPNIMRGWSQGFQHALIKRPIHYSKLRLRPEALIVLEEIRSRDAWEIFYITSRPQNLSDTTRAWARSQRLPDMENIYVTNGSKRAIIQLLGIEVFVDDMIHNVEELHDICAVILLTRPWNKDYHKDNHVRIDSLHELLPLLKEMK